MGTPAVALAALTAVLHRRTRQDTIAVACRIAGEGGLRAGTVIAQFADDPAFGTHVERMSAACAGLAPARAAGPDVSAHFFFDTPGPSSDPGGIPMVVATTAGPGIEIAMTGDPHSADARELTDLGEQMRTAMATGPSAPRRPVSVLRLTTHADLERLRILNGSGRAPVEARCIHELVAAQAGKAPDAPAVVFSTETISYGELDDRAEQLAAELRAAGVQPDAIVGVLLGRSPELVVTLLAILKAGSAYLALEPGNPVSRHERLLRDAGVEFVVTDEASRRSLPEGVTPLAPSRNGGSDGGPYHDGAGPSVPEPIAPRTPDRLAYVSYTSGSTGEPKGVAVPHRAISRLVRGSDWIDVKPDDVFFEVAPVAFDASTFELWAPLVHGCSLVVFPSGTIELEQVARTVRDQGVTVLLLATGLFHQMVAFHLDMFGGLRHVITGGDVASPESVGRLQATHPHLLFTNGYGPTENTTFTTCWTSTSAPIRGSVPIGGPISGTRTAVLDPELNPVPVGVVGELHASGEGLARGYVGHPGATAERFLPDPFSTEPGGRMYRTGDLVRWRADDTLEFIGRADQQVKIQGYRIEPAAIEAQLERQPEVRCAVVVPQERKSGRRLLAYVVPSDPDGDPGLGRRLREQLRSTLPTYMVPSAVLLRDSLPLNRNGKVDRRALPATTRAPRNLGNAYCEPRTRTEARLASLWGEVLGVEPVGIEDDFFDLGGHSLLAAELLGRLEPEFGVTVSARTLYTRAVVAELAAEIDARSGERTRRPGEGE